MNKFQRKRTKAGKHPCKNNSQLWNLTDTFSQYLFGALTQYKAHLQSENKYIENTTDATKLDEMIWAFNEILLDNMHAPSIMKEAEFERLHPDYLECTFIKRPDGSRIMEYKYKDLVDQILSEINCDTDKEYYERIQQGIEFYVQSLYENLTQKKLNFESYFSATTYINANHRKITNLD